MLEADLHAHTFFSNCGIHSHIEMLLCALDKGMKALAITDHGPALSGRVSSTVFDRMYEPVAGIKFLKGMECNLLEEPGIRYEGTPILVSEYEEFGRRYMIGLRMNF